MKLLIYNLQKGKMGERELSSQFCEEYRPDLIKRAVHALQSISRQAYGTSPEAGKRHSSSVSKRRRDYRGCYGFGISRVSRKIHSKRGTRMSWIGTFTPQTVGGRRSHPPKADKIFEQEINKKENRKAIRSAMAATLNKVLVQERGHHFPLEYPFIISSEIENLNKTSKVKEVLLKLGFEDELNRSLIKKIRAGLGKLRGRKYRTKKGILIVVEGECPLLHSANNLAGVDVAQVRALNVELLAPGAMPGRITLWTEKAVDAIAQEKLFQ